MSGSRSPARQAGLVPRSPARQAGVMLISALVAIVVIAFGLFGLARAYVAVSAATAPNQIVSSLAGESNALWGVIQANQAMLSSGSLAGTFNAGNVSSAPAPLQPWLTRVLGPTVPMPNNPPILPGGTVTIATFPDAVTGAACSPAGCLLSVVMSWNQNAVLTDSTASGLTRSQTFYFHFVPSN